MAPPLYEVHTVWRQSRYCGNHGIAGTHGVAGTHGIAGTSFDSQT